MALIKKDELLAFSFRVQRELHDEVDEVRKLAKGVGAAYDPSEALQKALRKDLAAARRQIAEEAKKSSKAD